ncbi:unnamed protein product [Tuber melanosporum]|uniref:(Perigord truffle) hypothetical protein n=1 Tax=Tuber melanosporum (strain Mel28) TaxID=656061 RepID=D5G8L4_TUBMM|nr:uncharacterized protein GSTUM_00002999001 [Tuber melanosporum]CAZ80857.1 unnamed protein product [Tuber melanosporum]
MSDSNPPHSTDPQDSLLQKSHLSDENMGSQENPGSRHHAPSREQHMTSTGSVSSREQRASLAEQVKAWLRSEKQRQKDRREGKRALHRALHGHCPPGELVDSGDTPAPPDPDSSGDEETQNSLNQLEAILAGVQESSPADPSRHQSASSRRGSWGRSRARSLMVNASDTDYASEGEPVVRSCEVHLETAEEVGIDEFRRQVLTLAHTLKCKGWRRVPLDRFRDISIERISGALTNTVSLSFVDYPLVGFFPRQGTEASLRKLLLRIYGPQVSHLIDRETELSILRRLARRTIGPPLLGTFENGRFEEFFNATTLTKDDIKVPGTSRHIAMRLKELHKGIELEDRERKMGPASWCNWYKWAPRAKQIMIYLDTAENLGKRGYICGCPWEKFEAAVEKYKEWLYDRYNGEENVKKQMVFAHNDTQYGNILRLQPSGESPPPTPSNEHRQLVVIDFEYASANTPGFEFANHFCEWMSNYHDPVSPHFMHHTRFPTFQERRNFLQAYVEHSLPSPFIAKSVSMPGTSSEPSTPPTLHPPAASSSSAPSSMLDTRIPGASDEEVDRLEGEAKAWRAASHAMWCVWGIVQAKNPGSGTKAAVDGQQGGADGSVPGGAKAAAGDLGGVKPESEEDESEFDYLGYAQQRALLFWGDMLALEIMKPGEVGDEVVEKAKIIAL